MRKVWRVSMLLSGTLVGVVTTPKHESALKQYVNIYKIHNPDCASTTSRIEGWTGDLFLFLPLSLSPPSSSFLSHFSRCQNDWWWPAELGVRLYTSDKWPARPWTGQKSIIHHLKSIKRGFLSALQPPSAFPETPSSTLTTLQTLNQTLCSYNQ